MPVKIYPIPNGECIVTSAYWSAGDLLSAIASIMKTETYTKTPVGSAKRKLMFTNAPSAGGFTAAEHVRLRSLFADLSLRGELDIYINTMPTFHRCEEESDAGDATIRFFVVLLECLRPALVAIGPSELSLRVLRFLVIASPNSEFSLCGPFPGSLMCHLDAPLLLDTLLPHLPCEDPIAMSHLMRLCTSSVKTLRLRDVDAQWSSLLRIMNNKACTLDEVGLHDTTHRLVIPPRVLLALYNSPRYIPIITTNHPRVYATDEREWKRRQQQKEAMHVFFSSASINNVMAKPHAFTWRCGKDVRRMIMIYVLAFAYQ